MLSLLPSPGLLLILGGLVFPVVQPRFRPALLLGLPLLVLFVVTQVPDGPVATASWLGRSLVLVQGDALSRIFATVFAIAALAGGLYALQQERVLELSAALVYAGAAIGVVFAGDLLTLFVFWEAMGIASTLVVWSNGPGARAAGFRYALVHLLGGVVLMAGIAGEVQATGSAALGALTLDSPARWLIILGLLVNAAAWPLAAWLPDAYPESSATGMVFLSAFTTKTAVYVLARTFPGTELLVWVGLAMIVYGIVYAMLETDIRRLLAYSIVSQVGFMVTGVGIGTPLAISGVAAHAFAHILYKALLLMAAGAVIGATGRRRTVDLGGLRHRMPVTAFCALIGAASIAALPLTSGFVAKSMIVDAAANAHLAVAWIVTTAGSVGTFVYVAFRFFWPIFVAAPATEATRTAVDPPAEQRWAMVLLAAACIGIGVAPDLLYTFLPWPTDYAPYTAAHVLRQIQFVIAGTVAFILLYPRLRPQARRRTLDVDGLWRTAGPALVAAVTPTIVRLAADIRGWLRAGASLVAEALRAAHGPGSWFARTWTTGNMAVTTVMLLTLFLAAFIF